MPRLASGTVHIVAAFFLLSLPSSRSEHLLRIPGKERRIEWGLHGRERKLLGAEPWAKSKGSNFQHGVAKRPRHLLFIACKAMPYEEHSVLDELREAQSCQRERDKEVGV